MSDPHQTHVTSYCLVYKICLVVSTSVIVLSTKPSQYKSLLTQIVGKDKSSNSKVDTHIKPPRAFLGWNLSFFEDFNSTLWPAPTSPLIHRSHHFFPICGGDVTIGYLWPWGCQILNVKRQISRDIWHLPSTSAHISPPTSRRPLPLTHGSKDVSHPSRAYVPEACGTALDVHRGH